MIVYCLDSFLFNNISQNISMYVYHNRNISISILLCLKVWPSLIVLYFFGSSTQYNAKQKLTCLPQRLSDKFYSFYYGKSIVNICHFPFGILAKYVELQEISIGMSNEKFVIKRKQYKYEMQNVAVVSKNNNLQFQTVHFHFRDGHSLIAGAFRVYSQNIKYWIVCIIYSLTLHKQSHCSQSVTQSVYTTLASSILM